MVNHRTSDPRHHRGMATADDSNKRTTSTTPEWRWAKIRATPARPSKTSPKASLPALAPWDKAMALSISVKYRGGAECWWEITARGRVWRRPGHLALDDVLQEVLSGRGGKPLDRPARSRAGGGGAGSPRGRRS